MNTPGAAQAVHTIEGVSEAFEGYHLPGQLRPAGAAATSPLLALHGARSNLHRLNDLLAPLQQLGVGSLAPSLSGHGPDSPMPVEQTSLAHNLREALRFAARLGPQLRMVYGSSMGGALAMRVAEHHADQVQVLALCGPALYPETAWSAPHFGAPFREAISTPFGFLQSRSLDFVRRFTQRTGRVLLIQGEWDGLQATAHGAPAGRAAGETTLQRADGSTHTVWSPIPAEVFSALADAAGARLQHIVLEGADHRVAAHLQQHPAVAHTLAGLMQQSLHAADQPRPAPAHRHLRIATSGQLLLVG